MYTPNYYKNNIKTKFNFHISRENNCRFYFLKIYYKLCKYTSLKINNSIIYYNIIFLTLLFIDFLDDMDNKEQFMTCENSLCGYIRSLATLDYVTRKTDFLVSNFFF